MPPPARIAPKTPELRRIGHRIVEVRQERGLSQEALADLAKIGRSYMSGIERGVRNPSVLHILRISKALEIPPSRLLN